MQKEKALAFERNDDGLYILPDMCDYQINGQRQRVVGGYIGAVYHMSIQSAGFFFFLTQMTGEFTWNLTASFPYSLAAKDGQRIFLPDCVPEGFTLSDPDHLKSVNIISLYSHWWHRQRQGLAPIIILNASPNHGVSSKRKSGDLKGKQKIEYVEIDDMDEEQSEGRSSAGDEEMTPAVKIGPPRGKGKRIPTHTKDSCQVAGPSIVTEYPLLLAPCTIPEPSTLSLPKPSPKKRTGLRGWLHMPPQKTREKELVDKVSKSIKSWQPTESDLL
jgi:hypothetical protein